MFRLPQTEENPPGCLLIEITTRALGDETMVGVDVWLGAAYIPWDVAYTEDCTLGEIQEDIEARLAGIRDWAGVNVRDYR